MIHRDFIETTGCNFWKITVDHGDSEILTMIPNSICLVMCLALVSAKFVRSEIGHSKIKYFYWDQFQYE
jgi:hypothetical protein